MGFADHFVPHDRLDAFTATIVADGVDAAVAAHAEEPPPSPLLAQREWIDHCYAGETVADIVAALRGHDAGHRANDAANLIATRSPIARVGRAGGGAPRRARSPRWKTCCARNTGPRAGHCAPTIWSRASAPSSSTRTATRSGRRRRWPAVTNDDIEAYFAPPIPT